MIQKKYNVAEQFLILIGIGAALAYAVCFEYTDSRTLTVWSYDLLDVLFRGEILDFYEYIIENVRGAQHFMCAGNFFPMIPLAVWNFPIWLVSIVMHIQNVSAGFFVLWTKLFYTVLFILTIDRMNRISEEVQNGENKWRKYIFLLMLGSSEIIFSLYYAGQDEIVYIFFMIQAIFYYIKGNSKGFYIFSIMSIMCCQLMLIPYLLLVIFEDKKWYSIASKLCIAMIPAQIFDIVYARNPRYRFHEGDNFVEWFFGRNVFHTGLGGVSVLAVVLVFIFGYAYLYHSESKSKKEVIRDKLYFVSMAVCAVTFLGWDQFYRSFIWVPFILLFVMNFNTDSMETNIMIVVTVGILRTFLNCISRENVLQTGSLSEQLKQFLENQQLAVRNINHSIFVSMINEGSQLPLLVNSAMIGGILFFFYMNCKEEKKKWESSNSIYVLLLASYFVAPVLIIYFFYKVLL
ncbi:MAG: hypothetical protein K2N87_16475 [Eubacterium sp.]|nr:hypothetical protein [Eubacterium sp.]